MARTSETSDAVQVRLARASFPNWDAPRLRGVLDLSPAEAQVGACRPNAIRALPL
jgi:hypothetical protein